MSKSSYLVSVNIDNCFSLVIFVNLKPLGINTLTSEPYEVRSVPFYGYFTNEQ